MGYVQQAACDTSSTEACDALDLKTTTARRFDGIWRPIWTLAAWVTQRGGSAEESIAGDLVTAKHSGTTVEQKWQDKRCCWQLRPPKANKANDAQVHEGLIRMSLVGGGCVAFACDTFHS